MIEDFPSHEPGSLVTESFFGGAVRWMAPELILALVEDDGRKPELTKASDVYGFASVCLEVRSLYYGTSGHLYNDCLRRPDHDR